MTVMSTVNTGRATLLRLGLGLAVIGAWELSRLDVPVAQWFGTAHGFPWRDHPLAQRVLHDGGRWLAWAMLALLAWDAARPVLPGPSQRTRRWALLATLGCLLLVPALKRLSLTSCPWDLALFGGAAAYVPHWLPGVADGGPGHCFPSGHAVAAFAFLVPALVWRGSPQPHHRRIGHALLAGVLVLGIVFAAAQGVRGAHFVSHSLWSAWLCWAVAEATRAALQAGGRSSSITPDVLA
jgi:membrane-associated PAP2 superfamily phosphatase